MTIESLILEELENPNDPEIIAKINLLNTEEEIERIIPSYSLFLDTLIEDIEKIPLSDLYIVSRFLDTKQTQENLFTYKENILTTISGLDLDENILRILINRHLNSYCAKYYTIYSNEENVEVLFSNPNLKDKELLNSLNRLDSSYGIFYREVIVKNPNISQRTLEYELNNNLSKLEGCIDHISQDEFVNYKLLLKRLLKKPISYQGSLFD